MKGEIFFGSFPAFSWTNTLHQVKSAVMHDQVSRIETVGKGSPVEGAISNLASRIIAFDSPDRVNLQLIEAEDIQLPDALDIPQRKLGFF
jgi:hypothetical protein